MLLIRNYLALFFVLFFAGGLPAKDDKGPVAKFSFNNYLDCDEVSGRKAKLVGTSYRPDRFGNANSSVFLYGSMYSYINLGTYKELKPVNGTISLWANIEARVWSGKGVEYNPLIITKYTSLDDFYESYAIYYFLEPKKAGAVLVKDSTRQVDMIAGDVLRRNEWHHFAISYDYNFCSLYIDGKLEIRLPKKFETKFMASDSVMVGTTANKKNSRYSVGAFDDIEFYDRVLTDSEIYELYKAPNPNLNQVILNWVLVFLLLGGIIVLIYFIIKRQIKKGIIKEKQKLVLDNKLLETELRVNRALMNPHFVFNSLNSLQNFILGKDYLQANNYLIKFSKLIRMILESNMSNVISLELEIELIERYLEIEDLRFSESIKSTITIDPKIIPSAIHIPVMMIQPFIENAIWHALLKKAGDKNLAITFSLFGEHYVQCTIEDNGTGRKKTSFNESKNKSLATSFIIQRLELLNRIYSLNCYLLIEDKPNNTGTIVKIVLPILKKNTTVAMVNNPDQQ